MTSEELRKDIEGRLTEKDKQFVNAARSYFNDYSKRVLNEATMAIYGYEKARVDNYFPIHTDKAFLKPTWENTTSEFGLPGFLQERLKGAANPIYLEGFLSVIKSQISKVARYAGLGPALTEFEKLYGVNEQGETSITSVQ